MRAVFGAVGVLGGVVGVAVAAVVWLVLLHVGLSDGWVGQAVLYLLMAAGAEGGWELSRWPFRKRLAAMVSPADQIRRDLALR
ncbi:hypothetical protein [Kitasatospora terrestris]|uniref:Uncharacterized protein n=1 Tax=Kitasatospora terrestris TaxID=258051 RepID=A0ABP9DMP6_9ACTN